MQPIDLELTNYSDILHNTIKLLNQMKEATNFTIIKIANDETEYVKLNISQEMSSILEAVGFTIIPFSSASSSGLRAIFESPEVTYYTTLYSINIFKENSISIINSLIPLQRMMTAYQNQITSEIKSIENSISLLVDTNSKMEEDFKEYINLIS